MSFGHDNLIRPHFKIYNYRNSDSWDFREEIQQNINLLDYNEKVNGQQDCCRFSHSLEQHNCFPLPQNSILLQKLKNIGMTQIMSSSLNRFLLNEIWVISIEVNFQHFCQVSSQSDLQQMKYKPKNRDTQTDTDNLIFLLTPRVIL